MKKIFVICWCVISLSAIASAQTLVTRSVVSDQKGKDYAPNIVPTSDGQWAVFWARDKGSENVMIRGRGLQSDGTILTGIRNLIGATLYRQTTFGGASLGKGQIVVGGTRESDRQIVTRVYDSKLIAKANLVATGQTGFNTTFAPCASGVLLAWTDAIGAHIAPLDPFADAKPRLSRRGREATLLYSAP
ncbi:MAG: hypothetical protein MUQ00_00835 [Candidatus Aminicenantes bacterium]|nr:hypothetical protein [Candidatus Aminicenantes bacterium]